MKKTFASVRAEETLFVRKAIAEGDPIEITSTLGPRGRAHCILGKRPLSDL